MEDLDQNALSETEIHQDTKQRRSLFGTLDRRSEDRGIVHRAVIVSKAFVAVVGAGGLALGGFAALGFRSISPAKHLETVAARIDSNAGRLALRVDTNVVRIVRLEHRVDTLTQQQALTNYMLCVAFRTDHPDLLPPDCAPIIQARRKP